MIKLKKKKEIGLVYGTSWISEGRKSLGSRRRRWEDNINMDLQDVE